MSRIYLDHNATTALRSQAREAMMGAMDVVGNPSSVHAEGRAATALVEKARRQVSSLVGCKPNQVIFTGSATEAAAQAAAQKARFGGGFAALGTEHDCLRVWSEFSLPALYNKNGLQEPSFDTELEAIIHQHNGALIARSAANSETGILADEGYVVANPEGGQTYAVICDITQLAGKMPIRYREGRKPAFAILSAHKFGGPKGVGALINYTSEDPIAILRGGGQELSRRAGTENIVGIAGFGAAAQAAEHDLEVGKWSHIEKLRKILERDIARISNTTIIVGNTVPRLPNTSCLITPGWRGEAQVMQMDLAGFAISAGSACASGKVKESAVLRDMGFNEAESRCAIRISLGHETSEDDIARFISAWSGQYDRFVSRRKLSA